ncbi:polyhydroxyalkanoate synthesis regulator DNA-binding domain-containing protein [bacterium]|nr:polyhydroxyalkanoate synthesis regulator DNA-binding domain-containing protein [candidate division CSSED10-310 bacterium]
MERTIKRYRNRKMYDTTGKRYVNFSDIEQMIRDNDGVRVVDNVTGEDITRQILIQILLRNEPRQSESQVPLDGLKNMLQNNQSPIFQAFRNVLNLGKDVVQQISTRIIPEEDRSEQNIRMVPGLVEMVKGIFEKVSDSTIRAIDGTLAREMLRVPKRDDWARIEKKLSELELRLMLLRKESKGGNVDDGATKNA